MELAWVASNSPSSGYGVLQNKLREHLLCPVVRFGDMLERSVYIPSSVRRGTKWRQYAQDHPVELVPTVSTKVQGTRLCVGPPWHFNWGESRKRVGFTMWETSALPEHEDDVISFADYARTADTLIVPSQHCKTLFTGVTNAPVHVAPLGIDRKTFPSYHRHKSNVFTFLMVGEITYRKGWDIAYSAFRAAFGDRTDVRLVIKTRGNSPFTRVAHKGQGWWKLENDTFQVLPVSESTRFGMECLDANVHIIRDNFSRDGMKRLYSIGDCFIWPTRGEGYGLPPREAAATGMPVITSAHTGQADAKNWCDFVIPYTMGEEAKTSLFASAGQWYQPDRQAIINAMQEVVAHRDYWQAKAWQRSLDPLLFPSWEDTAKQVQEICS